MRLAKGYGLRADIVFFLSGEGVNGWARVRHAKKLRLHDDEIISCAMHLHKSSQMHPFFL
jgi:hypothetical protein